MSPNRRQVIAAIAGGALSFAAGQRGSNANPPPRTGEIQTVAYFCMFHKDPTIQRLYGTTREANARIEIEGDEAGPITVWVSSPATGRREAVPAEDAAPWLLFLLDTVLEVGENHGEPWRQ